MGRGRSAVEVYWENPRFIPPSRADELKIKFRESFRPFAPCVLREYVDQVVEMQPGEESPYMLMVAERTRGVARAALERRSALRMQDPDLRVRVAVPRSTLPAVTHVDYSARVQTVDSPAWAIL